VRKFLLSVLLLPAVAFAEPVTIEKSIVCDNIDAAVKALTQRHKEQPIWVGNSKETKVVVLVNTETKSWTVLQYNEKAGCILELGEGFSINSNLFGSKSKIL
jgi:hypothetical protein